MVKKDRIIIAVLSIWTFIHTYLFILNFKRLWIKLYYEGGIFKTLYIPKDYFYPFTNNENLNIFDNRFYDYTELFIYVGGVWLGYFIYKLLTYKK